MDYKKSLSIYVVVGIILVLLTAASPTTPASVPASTTPIKIGFSNSMTGVYSFLGAFTVQAWQAWVKKVNRTGGILGHPVQAIFYDSESAPEKGVLNVKKLIQSDKVHVIMGENSTGISIPAGLACAPFKTTFLAASGSSAFEIQMMQAGPEIFKWCFRPVQASDQEQMAWLLTLYRGMNIKKVAVIRSEDGVGKSYADAFRSYAAKYPDFGIQVVDVPGQSYQPDAVTFGPLISGLKAHPEVQGVFAGGATTANALAIVAIKDAGIDIVPTANPAIVVPQIMGLVKVREGISRDPGLCIAEEMSFWRELPDSHPTKKFFQGAYNFWKEELNIEADSMHYATAYGYGVTLQDIFTRLLKDKPDILDKDLDTIRAAVRDYTESIKNLPLRGLVTMSPTDHCGFQWGTSMRLGQFKRDGKCHYLSQFATPPPERY